MREIKFRVWSNFYNDWIESFCIKDGRVHLGNAVHYPGNQVNDAILMQYTGLKDKNGNGHCKVYEGDIITIEGKIGGNIYENEPRRTDIVIPPIGTKDWDTAYKKAVERGFDYAE